MIHIAYDQGYVEVNASEYPVLTQALAQKNLVFVDDDKTGDLVNVRKIPRNFDGGRLTLCELFLSPLMYVTVVQEIGAGDNPVLYYKPLNCLVQVRREYTHLQN